VKVSTPIATGGGIGVVRDSVMSKYSEGNLGEYNLEDPNDFGKALRERIPRPFAFGPVDLMNLNNMNTVNADAGVKIRQRITKELIKNKDFSEKDSSLCSNGYKV
jgi:hypothetical protein